jgi:hypothetical protein
MSSLDSKDPKDRSRKPGRREILEKFGYTIINQNSSPIKNKISIVTNKKAS